MADPRCYRSHYREGPMTEEEIAAEERALFPNAPTLEEEEELCAILEERYILRNGFDDEDIRAEIEHWDRRREDLDDVSGVLDELGAGRQRNYGDERGE